MSTISILLALFIITVISLIVSCILLYSRGKWTNLKTASAVIFGLGCITGLLGVVMFVVKMIINYKKTTERKLRDLLSSDRIASASDSSSSSSSSSSSVLASASASKEEVKGLLKSSSDTLKNISEKEKQISILHEDLKSKEKTVKSLTALQVECYQQTIDKIEEMKKSPGIESQLGTKLLTSLVDREVSKYKYQTHEEEGTRYSPDSSSRTKVIQPVSYEGDAKSAPGDGRSVAFKVRNVYSMPSESTR